MPQARLLPQLQIYRLRFRDADRRVITLLITRPDWHAAHHSAQTYCTLTHRELIALDWLGPLADLA